MKKYFNYHGSIVDPSKFYTVSKGKIEVHEKETGLAYLFGLAKAEVTHTIPIKPDTEIDIVIEGNNNVGGKNGGCNIDGFQIWVHSGFDEFLNDVRNEMK